jgi:hypothetical protein
VELTREHDYTTGCADVADVSRRIWLGSPLYRAQELMLTAKPSMILAVRKD